MRSMATTLILTLCLTLLFATAQAAGPQAPDVSIPANIRTSGIDTAWMQARTDEAASGADIGYALITLRDHGYREVYADSGIGEAPVYGELSNGTWRLDCSGWTWEWTEPTVYATVFDDAGSAYRFGWPVEDWMACTEITFAPGGPYEMLFLPSEDYASNLIELNWASGTAYYFLEDGSLFYYRYTAKDFAEVTYDAEGNLEFLNGEVAGNTYPPLTVYR